MSIGLDIGKDAISVAQSALSSLTNIFHIGTPNSPAPPADVMSVASSVRYDCIHGETATLNSCIVAF